MERHTFFGLFGFCLNLFEIYLNFLLKICSLPAAYWSEISRACAARCCTGTRPRKASRPPLLSSLFPPLSSLFSMLCSSLSLKICSLPAACWSEISRACAARCCTGTRPRKASRPPPTTRTRAGPTTPTAPRLTRVSLSPSRPLLPN
jgi:hypothetical protein